MQLVPPRRDMEHNVAVEELVPLASVYRVRPRTQKLDHPRIDRDCLSNDRFEHCKSLATLTDGSGVDVVIHLAGQRLLVESVMFDDR